MKALVVAILLGVQSAGCTTAAPDQAGRVSDVAFGWRVDAIPWRTTAPNGTRFALLEGVRDQPGATFTYAFSIPAGVWDAVHFHSTTARVFVAKGVLKLGYGSHADRAAATSFPAGSYLIVPAKALHFDGADEDTIIIGVATGVWTTTYFDGSRPTSAGTPPDRR